MTLPSALTSILPWLKFYAGVLAVTWILVILFWAGVYILAGGRK